MKIKPVATRSEQLSSIRRGTNIPKRYLSTESRMAKRVIAPPADVYSGTGSLPHLLKQEFPKLSLIQLTKLKESTLSYAEKHNSGVIPSTPIIHVLAKRV